MACLFLLSGACGLVYQSVWSQYLGLLLGHAAYAQGATLVLFLGGLALGAWLAARCLRRIARPLAAYGWAELLLGLAALLFHPVFLATDALLFDTLLPAFAPEGGATSLLLRLPAAALLLLPQTVLLGASFPLLAAALLRGRSRGGGRVLARLYAINSAGAALGALLSGFVLLPALGLPGTLMLAGITNVLIGAIAIVLDRRTDSAVPTTPMATTPVSAPAWSRLVLAAAALTGLSSLVYEIAWLRMLALVLGSSQQAFELMLATFIAGLALGAWWVRRHLRGQPAALLHLGGRVQVAMGLAALATLPLYALSFDSMALLLGALGRTDAGYLLFNLASALIAALLMLPAAVCAGMTLPIFSEALRRGGAGEPAVGRIYAVNTLGAIGGVLLMLGWALPALGLKWSLWLAAALDLLLGLWLLQRFAPRPAGPRAALLCGLAALLAWGRASFDPRRMSAGVYRTAHAQIPADSAVLFQRDGRTASVSVHGTPGKLLILSTNGKPDAGLRLDPAQAVTGDEPTMVLLGLLGLDLHPDPRQVAVIGFGSGLTTHVLLGSDRPQQVLTLEIEPLMVEAARAFGSRVARAFDDPRARLQIDDARAALAASTRRYDLIVAEPSNPWVSGVGALFTAEFYARLPAKLRPGGLLVQWVHAYELDDPALLSILAALGASFPHYTVYASNHADFVIVASADRPVPAPTGRVFDEALLAKEAGSVGLRSTADLALRRVADRAQVEALIGVRAPPPNSDYHPFVALRAPRERFKQSRAQGLMELARGPLAAQFAAPGTHALPSLAQTTAFPAHQLVRERRAQLAWASLLTGQTLTDGHPGEFDPVRGAWLELELAAADCFARLPASIARQRLLQAWNALASVRPAAELEALWARAPWAACAPHAPPTLASLLTLLASASAPDSAADALIAAALAQPAAAGDPPGLFLALALTRIDDATPARRQALRERLSAVRDPLLFDYLWSHWH